MNQQTRLRQNARVLRQDMTLAEKRLWQVLRNKALGYKFRRQYAMGLDIVDFVCLERLLVIEVDGGQHLENPSDRRRDAWFQAQGYRTLRFWNHEVLTNLDGVWETIQAALCEAESGGNRFAHPHLTSPIKGEEPTG